MKKYQYLFILSSLSLLFCQKVDASCTQEEINDFKKIESEYKITYEFNKDSKDYTVFFTRKEPDKFDYYIDSADVKCDNIDENRAKCYNFKPQKYNIYIVGQTEECDDPLKEIILNLPYNSLSEDPLCEGIEDFVLCSPTYDKEIDYDTFVSRVNTYKKNKANQEDKTEQNKEDNEKNNTLNTIIDYIKTNIFTIIVIVVFVVLITTTIILTTKQNKKSRRLE